MSDANDSTSIEMGEFVRRLARSRRVVALFGAAGLALGVLVALVLPRVYICEATLLPASQDGGTSFDSDLLGLAGSLGVSLPGNAAPESRLYPAILKSERLLRAALLAPLDSTSAAGSASPTLLGRLGPKRGDDRVRLERAVDRVRRSVLRVSFDEETGIARVVVRLSTPELAQRTCGILLEELATFLGTERARKARDNRTFVESRRTEASGDLQQAEESLRRFRDANRRVAGSPDLLLEEARLTRSVRLQEEIYLELSRQHEIARIEEQKATPILEILDPPTPRYDPAFPRLPIFAGMGMLAGILLGSWIAAFRPDPRRV